MSYKCNKCGLGVIIIPNHTPIKACNCTVLIERKPITRMEKFKAFFGKKFFNSKPASIVCDIAAIAKGSSQFSN